MAPEEYEPAGYRAQAEDHGPRPEALTPATSAERSATGIDLLRRQVAA